MYIFSQFFQGLPWTLLHFPPCGLKTYSLRYYWLFSASLIMHVLCRLLHVWKQSNISQVFICYVCKLTAQCHFLKMNSIFRVHPVCTSACFPLMHEKICSHTFIFLSWWGLSIWPLLFLYWANVIFYSITPN